jgi:hypothetical protein
MTVLVLAVGCEPPSADSWLFMKDAEGECSHVSRRIRVAGTIKKRLFKARKIQVEKRLGT